jgi:hypothetical protein
MGNLINHHYNHLLILKFRLLIITFILFLLDNSNSQSLDIGYQSSIRLNDKLYFFGGDANYHSNNSLTNQIIYIDLPSSFSLNQLLPIKQLYPNSTIPPFRKTSIVLGGINNDTIYLIAGYRYQTPGTRAYGSEVYSINTTSFDTWTSESLVGQSLVNSLTSTIYVQDNNRNIYMRGYNRTHIYKFNINNLTFTTLKPINNETTLNPYNSSCHLLNDGNIIYIGLDVTTVNIIIKYCYYCYLFIINNLYL